MAYFAALEQLAEAADPASAVRWLRLLVAADPYRESAYRALMQALGDGGDRAAVTAVYRELQERLFRDLNTPPSPETEALYALLMESGSTVSVSARPAQTQETGRHLPIPLSDLIGREDAIAEVVGWLDQRRLVTLVGAGGIGKTRLAIAVAETVLPKFADGVWFVDLAVLSDGALVPRATSQALGIAEESQRSVIESLADALAGRSMLLVLDNCEHVAEACADLAFRLLSSSPGLSILATSRQALNVAGEQVYRVPSLAVPSSSENPMEYEAVRLFVDRATRVDSGFRLQARNASDVVEICRQLDGIPLAIEMAAARLRSLSVGEIKTRLNDRFRLLKSGNRGALPRQHTLRATIDWSYDQLSDAERNMLRQVSVFAGGWTVEAAEAVAGNGEDAEDLLSSLVDKSLAIAETQGERTRYRLLETVRRVRTLPARRGGGEPDRSHPSSRLLPRFCHRPPPQADGSGPGGLVLRLGCRARQSSAGPEPLRRATRWGRVRPAAGGGAIPLLVDAQPLLGRARTVFRRFGAPFGPGPNSGSIAGAERGRAARLAAKRLQGGDGALSGKHLHLGRELGDTIDVARALNNLALITRDQGDYESARAMHEESIAIFRQSDERLVTAICLANLGVVSQYQGDFDAARATFEEGLAVQRELGDRSAISVTLNSLGAVALDQEDRVFARQCHEEGLEIARELADRYGCASHLYGLGRATDDPALIKESLTTMYELGEKTLVTDHFAALASLARKGGRHEVAVRLFAARATLRGATGSPLPGYELKRMERELDDLREALGEADFNQIWAVGCAMSMEDAIEYALLLGDPSQRLFEDLSDRAPELSKIEGFVR